MRAPETTKADAVEALESATDIGLRHSTPHTEGQAMPENMTLAAGDGNTAFDIASLRRIPYQGRAVITTDLLAKAYGTDVKNVQMNYSRNEARFEEGVHFFKLTGDALRAFKNQPTGSGLVADRAAHLILWTARGAARHAKILDTDQAWAMFEKLEDAYFNPRQPAPQIDVRNPSQLAQIAIQLIEVNKDLEADKAALAAKVQEQAPTVAAFDRIAKSDGSMCITDAAKDLQVRPKDLFLILRQRGWIYSRPGKYGDIAYQDKIQAGLLEHKVTVLARTDGTEKTVEQVRVTPKGLAKLAKLMGSGAAATPRPNGGGEAAVHALAE